MSREERLYDLLKEAFILLDAGDRCVFDRFGLTVPRYYALHHIAVEPGISISQLSQRMLCDKSNVTRIVKGLESEGYVCRRAHETDGRTLRLYLTEMGTAVRNEVSLAHRQYNEERLSCLTEEARAILSQQLSRLTQHLRDAPLPQTEHSHASTNVKLADRR